MANTYRWMQKTGRTVASVGAMFLMSVFPVLNAAPVAHAIVQPPVWSVVGNFDITFSCTSGCGGDWPHTMSINSENTLTGDFSGTGHYIPDPSYTWNVTGNTSDSNVTFTIVYTGTGAGSIYNEVGTIDDNGHMSGTASGMGQIFTWNAVNGTAQEIVGNGIKPAACTGTYTHIIQGTNGNDVINGTASNDLIFGYGGNDVINGGAGNDCIVGGTGNDKIDGGSGNDVIFGQGGDDTLSGGSGNDSLYGGIGNDILNGNAGNDSLTGDAGTDSANGGTGINTCSAETQVSC